MENLNKMKMFRSYQENAIDQLATQKTSDIFVVVITKD